MADNTKKIKVRVKQSDGSYLTLHPETQSDITDYDSLISELDVDNVKAAIDLLAKKVKSIPDSFVASVNELNGDLELKGNNGITISKEGHDIIVSADIDINNIEQEIADINEEIKDLDDIRNGSNLGKTAVQPKYLEDNYRTFLDQNRIDNDIINRIDTKQDELTAGENIKIKNNVISATCTNYLTEVLQANLDIGGIRSGTIFNVNTPLETVIRQLLHYDRVLTSIEITKQPKVVNYKVGEFFNPFGVEILAHYDDNSSKIIYNYTFTPIEKLQLTDTKVTFSYTENAITQTVDVDITVKDVEPSDFVTIYYGGLDDIPTSLENLTEQEINKDILLGNYSQHITAGNVETEEGQYVTFAIPEQYKVTKWVASSLGIDLAHTLVNVDNYNIYYLDNKSYDENKGGITYTITIEEV